VVEHGPAEQLKHLLGLIAAGDDDVTVRAHARRGARGGLLPGKLRQLVQEPRELMRGERQRLLRPRFDDDDGSDGAAGQCRLSLAPPPLAHGGGHGERAGRRGGRRLISPGGPFSYSSRYKSRTPAPRPPPGSARPGGTISRRPCPWPPLTPGRH